MHTLTGALDDSTPSTTKRTSGSQAAAAAAQPLDDLRSPIYSLIAANVAVFLLANVIPLSYLQLSTGKTTECSNGR